MSNWNLENFNKVKDYLGCTSNDQYVRIKDIKAAQFIEMFEKDWLDKTERQNDGPDFNQLYELAKMFPNLKFSGYIINPPRDDFRLSIDEIIHGSNDEALVSYIFNHFNEPDEIEVDDTIRVWWD